MKCRHCGSALSLSLIDLGSAPPSNAYISADALRAPEKWFPLRVMVCETCWLVQTEDFVGASELFTDDYAYFSSFSTSWLAHARNFVASIVEQLKLGTSSLVAEIASNDGYLLKYVRERGIPCYGVEPTAATAAAARIAGIDIVEAFFGRDLARDLSGQGRQADLIVANNVLAHVPDINDFVSGIAMLLKPTGVATFEFPHLLNLVCETQFDTIYHEHYSYLSLTAVTRILQANGLDVFDVEQLATHGGSLRVFARRIDSDATAASKAVAGLLAQEREAGVTTAAFYAAFQTRAEAVKDGFLGFLLEKKRKGSKIGAYGAAAKGNTLLNWAGVRPDLLPYVVDRNPSKQGKFLPGSRIPIVDESRLRKERPDCVLILPWNLREEIEAQLSYVRDWGGRFVRAVPKIEESA